MSPEQIELQQLAQAERAIAWEAVKRLPGRTGDTLAAFVRQHPVLTMSSAAAIAVAVVARQQKKSAATASHDAPEPESESAPKKGFSLPMALAAIGTQMLPELLKLAGLTAREHLEDEDADAPLADKPPGRSPSDGREPDHDGTWQPRDKPDLVNVRA